MDFTCKLLANKHISMYQFQHKFTVFTPTYNRKNKLPKVFKSLKDQTFSDFEWLIVDDGSIDGTDLIVDDFKSKSNMSISYYWKPNGGKHTAFNLGVQKARGELFLTLDSDDFCDDNSLEVFMDVWNAIENKNEFSAVTALCKDENGKIVGDGFPSDIFDSDSLEIKYKYRIRGEKWGFQRTEILRKYPFPEPEGTKFVRESMVWDKISRKYKTRFVNIPLRTYVQSEDSLSKSSPLKNIKASILSHRFTLNDCFDYFNYNPKRFIKTTINLVRFSLHHGDSPYKKITNKKAVVLITCCLMFGFLLYLRDLMLYLNKN